MANMINSVRIRELGGFIMEWLYDEFDNAEAFIRLEDGSIVAVEDYDEYIEDMEEAYDEG